MLVLLIPQPPQKRSPSRPTWPTLIAGFRYIWHEKIVLGAISLDLFAVLLGGAVALLPVYARDILDVGPWGLACCAPRPASARSPSPSGSPPSDPRPCRR